MVVEDEALVAADLEDRLSRLGYMVIRVMDNAEEALEAIEEIPPDLVLMDIQLGGKMDGIEAAYKIRKEYEIPVVYVTAHADAATLSRAGATEPFGYVLKPFEERELHASIEMALYRHRAESKIRKMERWLSTTLQSIGDAVIATDLEGRVTFVNTIAEELTGHLRRDTLGKHLSSVLHLQDGTTPDAENLIPSILQEAEESGLILHLEKDYYIRTRSNGLLPIGDSFSPIRDNEGMITGFVIVFRDRSNQLKAAEERKHLEQKMQEAQRLESLGVMAGGIAHDFNNLLSIILGNISLCKDKSPQSSPLQQHFDEVENATVRGASLCSQMLAYAGKGRFILQTEDFNTFTREIAQLLRMSIGKNCHLDFDLAPDPLLITGDLSQIQQIIMNLVINASDAIGPEQDGVIHIKSSKTSLTADSLKKLAYHEACNSGDFCLLQIKDNGCGMSEATIAKIFDPFFTTKTHGRGLGLASVIGIVRSHKGALNVKSHLGKGTTFEVYLPEVKERVPDRALPGVENEWEASGTVLVADDDASIRSLTSLSLERLGFKALPVADGLAAMDILGKNMDDIRMAFLDLTMPKLDGLQTALKLKQMKPGLPVVLMSGYSKDVAQEMFQNHKLRYFLQKPFTLSDIKQAAMEALNVGSQAS